MPDLLFIFTDDIFINPWGLLEPLFTVAFETLFLSFIAYRSDIEGSILVLSTWSLCYSLVRIKFSVFLIICVVCWIGLHISLGCVAGRYR